MNEYSIVECRLCGRLMKRYPMAVYRGDVSCCSSCNDKVNTPSSEEELSFETKTRNKFDSILGGV